MTIIPLQFDRNFKPAGLLSTDSAVSYNGFKFPPCITSKATITPVYDDANRIVKYMRIDFHITFLLFHGLNLGYSGTAAAPDHGTDLYSGSYSRANNVPLSVTDSTLTVDEEMNYLRSRLTEPGQPFVFYLQGIGTVKVNDNTSVHFDVDNGPKPRVIGWQPLTNKCCRVEWQVSTSYSACNELGTLGIAQFPFTIHFNINERGLTVRTITGKLEIPLTRVPQANQAHAGISQNFEYAAFRDQIVAAFPMLSRFQRSQSYTLSADRKNVEFTITDSEIDSDEAFGEGCQNERVKLSASSPREDGFAIWAVSLSGHIDVMPGYTKDYALAEINRLFTRYYQVCAARALGIQRQGSSSQEVSEGGGAGTSATITPSHYLTKVELSEEVFGRSVDFSIQWQTFTSLANLLTATGLFVPARASNSPDTNPDPTVTDLSGDALNTKEESSWGVWKASLGTFLDAGGYAGLGFNQDDDVIVSLCDGLQQGAAVPMDSHTPLDEVNDQGNKTKNDERLAGDSWAAYQPRFALEIREHTGVHHPLSDYVPTGETARSPDAAVVDTNFNPNFTASTPDANQVPAVHARREPSYILRFSGYAERLNYPVPIPRVEKAYGCPVKRIGIAYILPKYLGAATDPATSKSYKRYGLIWSIQYALIGTPSNDTIKTDAHKDIYKVS